MIKITLKARCVKAGIYPALFALGEQLGNKIRLQKRLAARNGYSARFAEILSVSLAFICKLLRSVKRSAAHFPRIGIVAAAATQRAPLHKDHESNTGAVKRAERLYRMNAPEYLRGLHGMFCL